MGIKKAAALDAAIEGMRSELVQLVSDAVKAQDGYRPGDTRKAAEVVAAFYSSIGERAEIVAADETKPNVILKLDWGPGPSLLLNSHIDTVPEGRLSDWESRPYSALLREGYLHGRGSADAKASVAAMAIAAKALKLSEAPKRGSLILAAVSDEEEGGRLGTKYLIDRGLLDPDFVIIGEITGNRLAVAEKGAVFFKVTTRGRAAHGSTPWVGVNAIEDMVAFLSSYSSTISSKISSMRHPLLPPPSYNIGTISGGVRRNVVADECSAEIDRRILPGETVESARQEIMDIFERISKNRPAFKAEVDLLHYALPFELDHQSKIIKTSQRILAQMGLNADLVGYKQASDGWFFADKGVETIIIGPGEAELAHSPNEKVEIDAVVQAAKIYANIAAAILGG